MRIRFDSVILIAVGLTLGCQGNGNLARCPRCGKVHSRPVQTGPAPVVASRPEQVPIIDPASFHENEAKTEQQFNLPPAPSTDHIPQEVNGGDSFLPLRR